MKVKPLQDRLVIKPVIEEHKTAGGIIMPDTVSKEKPVRGEVIAVGPGKFDKEGKRMALDVKVGDEVMYGKYAGTEFKQDDQEYLIVDYNDVLAIIEN
jgi:chaperonin GroES